jgi:hypothetical protein
MKKIVKFFLTTSVILGVGSVVPSIIVSCSCASNEIISKDHLLISGHTLLGFKGYGTSASNYDYSWGNQLVVPDEITEIGTSAFENCVGIKTIDFNKTQGVLAHAFSDCSSICYINLGMVNSIGDKAFMNCSSITSVSKSFSNNAYIFYDGDGNIVNNNSISRNGFVRKISDSDNIITPVCGLSGGIAFGNIKMPANVNTIDSNSFYSCRSILGLDLNNVVSVNQLAFGFCSNVENLSINKVINFGDSAFSYCSKIKSLHLSEGINKIPYCCFQECSSLTGELSIPASVTVIDQASFSGCSKFSNLKIDSGSVLTSILGYAFGNCNKIAGSLTIPNNVKIIGQNAFINCSSLNEINFPNGLTTIGSNAFNGCNSLNGVLTIPNSVTNIGEKAFANCTSLTSIQMSTNIHFIGGDTFFNCPQTVGDSTNPNKIFLDTDDNLYYMSIGAKYICIGKSNNVMNGGVVPKDNITFKQHTKVIADDALSHTNILSVTFDTSSTDLEIIGNNAF